MESLIYRFAYRTGLKTPTARTNYHQTSHFEIIGVVVVVGGAAAAVVMLIT